MKLKVFSLDHDGLLVSICANFSNVTFLLLSQSIRCSANSAAVFGWEKHFAIQMFISTCPFYANKCARAHTYRHILRIHTHTATHLHPPKLTRCDSLLFMQNLEAIMKFKQAHDVIVPPRHPLCTYFYAFEVWPVHTTVEGTYAPEIPSTEMDLVNICSKICLGIFLMLKSCMDLLRVSFTPTNSKKEGP